MQYESRDVNSQYMIGLDDILQFRAYATHYAVDKTIIDHLVQYSGAQQSCVWLLFFLG